MPQNRPKPSDWLAQQPRQSPSDFLASDEGKNPAPTAPPALPPHVLPNSERAVNAFNAQNPPANPAVRVAGEGLLGAASGVGIPETQHPIMDAVTGLYRTLTAPPQPGWETGVQKTGFLPAVRLGLGAVKGAYENVKEGLPEAVSGLSNAFADYKMGEPMTEDLARGVHGTAKTAATLLPLRELVGPPAVEAAKAVDQGARNVVRDVSGAGPKVLAKQTGEVATKTADVAADNAKAATEHGAANEAKLREARDAAASDATERLAKQTASDVNWEEGTKAKMRKYLTDVADNEKAHGETSKQIQAENEANKAGVARRGQLEEQLTQHRAEFQNRLRATRDAEEAAAKEQYPDITGNGEPPEADAVKVGQDVQAAAAEKLKGSGSMPGPIARIISDYTPAEGDGGGVMHEDELHGPGSPLYEDLKAQGKLQPGEEATPGQTPQKATVDMLHGQYSELGRALYDAYRTGAQGDVIAAIAASRDAIGGHLRELYKNAGQLPAFNKAQQNYARVMSRYYDRTSPIAKLLNDTTSTAGFDPARAQTGEAPRTAIAERLLKNPENVKIIQRYLKDTPGAPLDILDDITRKTAERDTLPKKFTAKQIPVKKDIAVPDLPLREELAQPEKSTIPRGGLTPPPEAKPNPAPFDRKTFIKDKIQQTAESFKRVSPWETAAAVGAGGLLLDKGVLPAMSALSYPVVRYGIGRMLEHPGFQDWAAREGVTPPPVGAGAQPGPATPFQPPPGAPPSAGGVPPGTPPPPPGAPPSVPPSLAQRGLEAIRQGQAAGKKALGDFADTFKYPESHNAQGWLESGGVKIPQPLTDAMHNELDTIWKEKGQAKLTKPEARSVQTVLDSWGKGTFDSDDAINRIRGTLGLKARRGWE